MKITMVWIFFLFCFVCEFIAAAHGEDPSAWIVGSFVLWSIAALMQELNKERVI